jgi:hypothetical protein
MDSEDFQAMWLELRREKEEDDASRAELSLEQVRKLLSMAGTERSTSWARDTIGTALSMNAHIDDSWISPLTEELTKWYSIHDMDAGTIVDLASANAKFLSLELLLNMDGEPGLSRPPSTTLACWLEEEIRENEARNGRPPSTTAELSLAEERRLKRGSREERRECAIRESLASSLLRALEVKGGQQYGTTWGIEERLESRKRCVCSLTTACGRLPTDANDETTGDNGLPAGFLDLATEMSIVFEKAGVRWDQIFIDKWEAKTIARIMKINLKGEWSVDDSEDSDGSSLPSATEEILGETAEH